MAIKQTELKSRFVDLYDAICSTIERLNKAPRKEDNVKILEYATKKLLELQELVNTNITKTFNTKTYIENEINLQHSYAIFSSIDKILKEISAKKAKK